MKDKVFDQLVESTKEAIAIERGEQRPARVTIYFKPKEMKKVRTTLGMTQKQFSNQFGIPVATVRHWEQGLREPDRAAMALYQILSREPKAAIAAFS